LQLEGKFCYHKDNNFLDHNRPQSLTDTLKKTLSWTGSIYFSTLVRTTQSRRKFANILVDAVEKYNLNGLNIDWGKIQYVKPRFYIRN
jgi:GH18 family chitinase